MITLAAGGGDYIFLLVMLVFGLINWLASKAKEGKAPPPSGRPPQPPFARSAESGDPEDERMRRFLEALGVPPDAPEQPAASPTPRSVPIPRPVPAAPRPTPPPLPQPEWSLDEAEITTEPVERIHIPELQTAAMPEFETVTSRVSADPNGDFATVSSEISAIPTVEWLADIAPAERESAGASRAIFTALRSRSDVRNALVLREILGPPRSLQP